MVHQGLNKSLGRYPLNVKVKVELSLDNLSEDPDVVEFDLPRLCVNFRITLVCLLVSPFVCV